MPVDGRGPGPGRHQQRAGADEVLNPWLEERLWRVAGTGGQPVVDLGCGRGYWLGRMAARGLVTVGVEPDPERAADAGGQGPVVVADGTSIPMRDDSVGLVWSIHVLHHLPDPVSALAEIARVLRPGGHLILAETVEDHPLVRLGRRLHPEWDGVHVHSRFSSAALMDMMAGAGLTVVDSRQHSLVSFAAWALPAGDRWAWARLTRLEALLPRSLDRWGAHLECVAVGG